MLQITKVKKMLKPYGYGGDCMPQNYTTVLTTLCLQKKRLTKSCVRLGMKINMTQILNGKKGFWPVNTICFINSSSRTQAV